MVVGGGYSYLANDIAHEQYCKRKMTDTSALTNE